MCGVCVCGTNVAGVEALELALLLLDELVVGAQVVVDALLLLAQARLEAQQLAHHVLQLLVLEDAQQVHLALLLGDFGRARRHQLARASRLQPQLLLGRRQPLARLLQLVRLARHLFFFSLLSSPPPVDSVFTRRQQRPDRIIIVVVVYQGRRCEERRKKKEEEEEEGEGQPHLHAPAHLRNEPRAAPSISCWPRVRRRFKADDPTR